MRPEREHTEHIATLFDVLCRHAALQPQAESFVFLGTQGEPKTLTFTRLLTRVQAIAAQLQERCARGDRVFLMYQPGLDFIEAILACFAAGAVAVPIQPLQNRRALPRLTGIIADAGGCIVLTNGASLQTLSRVLPNLKELIPRLQWICTDGIADCDAKSFRPGSLQRSQLAFLQYTSGSTGVPKGVMVSHDNLLSNLQSLRQAFESQSKDIFLGWLPMYHDMGLIENVFHSLYAGACSVLFAPMTFLMSPITWLNAICDWRGTISGAPNFAYQLCTDRISHEEMSGIDLSSWRLAFNGAEPVKAHAINAFIRKFTPHGFKATAFLPCYGMAEATLFVSGASPHAEVMQLTVDAEQLARNAVVPCASSTMALVGCGNTYSEQVCVVDPQSLQVLPDDAIGELWISGPSVAAGYWGKPELTAATFHAYTADGAGPYLRSGDLGFWHGGELFIAGRLKDLIIIRGKNYYPHDIESAVEQSHEALQASGSAAFVVEVESQVNLVVAAEVRRSALSRLDDELQREIIGALREEVLSVHGLRVADVVLLKQSTLPKTSSGKVRRSHCRDLYLSRGFQYAETRNRQAVLAGQEPLDARAVSLQNEYGLKAECRHE